MAQCRVYRTMVYRPVLTIHTGLTRDQYANHFVLGDICWMTSNYLIRGLYQLERSKFDRHQPVPVGNGHISTITNGRLGSDQFQWSNPFKKVFKLFPHLFHPLSLSQTLILSQSPSYSFLSLSLTFAFLKTSQSWDLWFGSS